MNKLMKMTLERGNIPSVILKSDEQMAKEAEARAQQQQAQGMQEAALNMSEVIKNTGHYLTLTCSISFLFIIFLIFKPTALAPSL
jgi:hypothetical protein